MRDINQEANIRKNRIYISFLLVGILFRFLISFSGHNFDFESYKIVGKLVSDFENVYANTYRYNYAPIFFMILGVFYKVSLLFNNNFLVYRLLIIGFLTLIDILLARFIFKKKNPLLAILFFLNPVSIIITGFHNQFDNLAVLLFILASDYYNDRKFNSYDIKFLIFMTLSLMSKHIAAFYLFWILVRNDISVKKKLIYVTIPPALFLISFLPFAVNPNGLEGILNNVFFYRSFNNFPLVKPLILLFNIPWEGHYFIFFIMMLLFAGYIFRNVDVRDSYLLYLICLVCFSSAVANQYLAIPLVSLFLLSRSVKYIYVIAVSVFYLFHSDGLNLLMQDQMSNLLLFYVKHGYSIACYLLFLVLLFYIHEKKIVHSIIVKTRDSH